MHASGNATAYRLGAAPVADDDLPMFDIVAPRLARGLAKAMGLAGGLTVGTVRTIAFADWKASLPAGVAVARFDADPLKDGLLLSVPATTIAALMDIFYGGEGAIDATQAGLGAAGRQFFGRLAGVIGATIDTAWADVGGIAARLEHCAYAAEDVAFNESADMLVVQTFDHARHGTVEIVYPLAALRGLTKPAALTTRCPDPIWRKRLSDAVMQTRLPVRTIIARPTVPLGRLMALAPGDVIPVLLPTSVPLTVAGRLLAHGSIGEANGRAAFKISTIDHGAFHD